MSLGTPPTLRWLGGPARQRYLTRPGRRARLTLAAALSRAAGRLAGLAIPARHASLRAGARYTAVASRLRQRTRFAIMADVRAVPRPGVDDAIDHVANAAARGDARQHSVLAVGPAQRAGGAGRAQVRYDQSRTPHRRLGECFMLHRRPALCALHAAAWSPELADKVSLWYGLFERAPARVSRAIADEDG